MGPDVIAATVIGVTLIALFLAFVIYDNKRYIKNLRDDTDSTIKSLKSLDDSDWMWLDSVGWKEARSYAERIHREQLLKEHERNLEYAKQVEADAKRSLSSFPATKPSGNVSDTGTWRIVNHRGEVVREVYTENQRGIVASGYSWVKYDDGTIENADTGETYRFD